MDKPDFSEFERPNPIQRIVGFIASLFCCIAIIMRISGSITTDVMVNNLLIWGLGGYFVYWFIGKLPKLLNKTFNGFFWAIGQGFYALGNVLKFGFSKANFKPKKSSFRWRKYIGLGIIFLTILIGVSHFSLLRCLADIEANSTTTKAYCAIYEYIDIWTFLKILDNPIIKGALLLFEASKWMYAVFFSVGYLFIYWDKKIQNRPADYQENYSSSNNEKEQNHSYQEEEFTQESYSTSTEEELDPLGDWRFDAPRYKTKYIAMLKGSEDRSISLDERTQYYKNKQLADEGKMKGIKALP